LEFRQSRVEFGFVVFSKSGKQFDTVERQTAVSGNHIINPFGEAADFAVRVFIGELFAAAPYR
jgi:hypothetical protein